MVLGLPSAKQIEIDKIVDRLVKVIKKKHCPLSEAARECGISKARAQYLIEVRYGGVRSLIAMLFGNNRREGARGAKMNKYDKGGK